MKTYIALLFFALVVIGCSRSVVKNDSASIGITKGMARADAVQKLEQAHFTIITNVPVYARGELKIDSKTTRVVSIYFDKDQKVGDVLDVNQ